MTSPVRRRDRGGPCRPGVAVISIVGRPDCSRWVVDHGASPRQRVESAEHALEVFDDLRDGDLLDRVIWAGIVAAVETYPAQMLD